MAQAIRPVMLVILDGFGWREATEDNAVRLAKTPTFTKLWQSCPHAFLHTSGRDVGLPDGQMGNSEVGHMNIGAGRVVHQELVRIGDAIADGSLAKAAPLTEFIGKLRAIERHLPPARPGLARRGALAPGPRRRAGQDPARRRHPHRRARLHRRPRHPAAIRRRRPRPPARRAAGGRAASPPSAAATSPWTATSAGTASPRPTPRSPTPTRPRFDDPVKAVQAAYDGGEIRRVHPAGGDRRLQGHAGRRRHPVLQLPRRPGPGNPRRPARSAVRRLPAQARPSASPPRSAWRSIPTRWRRSSACCSRPTSWSTSSAAWWRRPARPSSAWRRPRNTRTSPIS